MNTTPNPAYEACVGQPSPYTGGSWGPLGINGTNELKVTLRLDYTYWALGLSAPDVNSPTATAFGSYPAGTHLLATRNGVSGGGSTYNSDGTFCIVNGYLMSGTQTITVEQVPSPVVHALKNPVTSGEVVTFVASLAPEITQFGWAYNAGDTLAAPRGAPIGSQIWSCSGRTSCSIPVSASGRMYFMDNTAHSEIVWVKNPSAHLTLSCTPTEVPAGGTTTCTAATSPAGQPLQVVEWFFVPDSATAHDETIQALDCATENPCVTHIPSDGNIFVRATVGGIEQTAASPVMLAGPVLTVTAQPNLVERGSPVTFSAVAPGAQSVQVESWIWMTAGGTTGEPTLGVSAHPRPSESRSGARSASTPGILCDAGINPCIAAVSESGRAHVSALVDGVRQFAESPVVQVIDTLLPDSSGSNPRADYAISCTPVVRGQHTTCSVVAPDSVTVLRWEFIGSYVQNPPAETTAAREWSGKAVLPGTVRAVVMVGGVQKLAEGQLSVTNRSGPGWTWGPNDWHFQLGSSVPFCLPGRFDLARAQSTLSLNIRRTNCLVGRIEPDMRQQPGAGVSYARVTGGGPNDGIWYVDSTHYEMDRAAVINPTVDSSGAAFPLYDPADISACNSSSPINFYYYNQLCRGMNMLPLMTAVWNHEGLGTGGQANGHESRARLFAPSYDPNMRVEALAAGDSATLSMLVTNQVGSADTDLSKISGDHHFVKDNYILNGSCGSVWAWNGNALRYVSYVMLVDTTKTCM